MVRRCLVCQVAWNSRDSRSFHKFPRDSWLKQLWMNKLSITEEHLRNSKVAVICSDHFAVDDSYRTMDGKSMLKFNAVPKLTSRRHDSWLRALGRDPTKEHLSDKNCVCEVHFRDEDKFVANNQLKLKFDAIPSLNLRKQFIPKSVRSCSRKLEEFSMPSYCIVCRKDPIPNDGRSFHRFPSDEEMKQKWLEVIGKKEVSKSTAICSDHFDPQCFHETHSYTHNRRLLKNAVPSANRVNGTPSSKVSHVERLRNDSSQEEASTIEGIQKSINGNDLVRDEVPRINDRATVNSATADSISENEEQLSPNVQQTEMKPQWGTARGGRKNDERRCLGNKSSVLVAKEESSEESVDNPKEATFIEEEIKKPATLRKIKLEKNKSSQSVEEINAKGARVKKVATWLSNISFEEMATPGESADTKAPTAELNGGFNSGGTFCSCCFTKDAKLLKFRLGDKCFENITAKDAILKILPCIDFPLMDSDAICNMCFETLMKTLRFIKTFMNVNSCRLARSHSENKAVEVIDVDSDSFDTAEREDGEAGGNKSISKNHSVVQLTNGKNSNDSFEIELVVEDDEALDEEERYFNEISFYCATKTMYTTADHRAFRASEVEPFDRSIIIPNAQDDLLNHFLFDIYKDITIYQHLSAFQVGNKRLLLLGNIYYKFCSLCEKQFPSQEKFKKHLTEEKCKSSEQNNIEYFFKSPSLTSLKCDVCGASFCRLYTKRAHMTKCVMFECFYCNEKLNGNGLLEHSRILHKDPKPFKCHKCPGAFRSYKKYKQHNCDRVVCTKCGRTPASMKAHQCNSLTRIRSRSTFRRCPHCKERTPLSEFKEHIRKHMIYYCQCKRGFVTMERLEAHKKLYCQSVKRLCNICGKLFAKGHIQQHLKTHEQRVRSFECEICKRKYFSEYRLKNHMNKTHLCREVVCEYCGITLRENSIRGHLRLKHNRSISNLKCPLPNCEKVFSRRDYLNRHVARHQKLRRIPGLRMVPADQMVTCKFCLKEFKGLQRLKVHLVHHMRLSRYKCRYCTLTYTCYTNRMRHEKKFHNKSEEVFRCNTCWKIEPSMEDLNNHIESVHKTKKYKCGTCHEAFSRHFQLNAHFIAEHVKPNEIEEERNYVIHKALSDYVDLDECGKQIASPSMPKNHIEYEVESGKSEGEEYTDNELECNDDEDIIDESMYRMIEVDENGTEPDDSEEVYFVNMKDGDSESEAFEPAMLK